MAAKERSSLKSENEALKKAGRLSEEDLRKVAGGVSLPGSIEPVCPVCSTGDITIHIYGIYCKKCQKLYHLSDYVNSSGSDS